MVGLHPRLPLSRMLPFFVAALVLAKSRGLPAPLPEEGAGQAVRVARGPFKSMLELDGVLVPADTAELGFWPRAYSGELRVEEAAPHGKRVKENDVVLRLRDEPAWELLLSARWSLRTADRGLADARARGEEQEADLARDIARAEQDLDFAAKALKGYLDVDRPLRKEEHDLSERSHRHGIEDQEDEIAQLGKMYKEDELTEETEEIVLKRAKRGLSEQKKRLDLFLKRHQFSEEYTEPQRKESLENGVKDREKALKELRRSRDTKRELAKIEVEKLEHEVAMTRKKITDLEGDIERLTFRAPHDGVLIHGSFEEKAAVQPIRKGGLVVPHQTILTVARSAALKARISVKEKDRYRLHGGMAASVIPEAMPEARLAGSLEAISGFPLPDNTWNAHVVFGHEDERLLPLLKCKVAVVIAEEEAALTVPSRAVFRKGAQAICYLRGKSPFGIIARTVVTGPEDGKVTIVREGLSEGDEVLVEEPSP